MNVSRLRHDRSVYVDINLNEDHGKPYNLKLAFGHDNLPLPLSLSLSLPQHLAEFEFYMHFPPSFSRVLHTHKFLYYHPSLMYYSL